MISKKELLEKMGELSAKYPIREMCWKELYYWIKEKANSLPDSQPDLLPFQWPIPEGMEAVTRDGREVEQLVRFDMKNVYPIFGVINNNVFRWSNKGYFICQENQDKRDLFLRRVEKKVWVVEWPHGTMTVHDSLILGSEPNGAKAIYEATLKLINQQS